MLSEEELEKTLNPEPTQVVLTISLDPVTGYPTNINTSNNAPTGSSITDPETGVSIYELGEDPKIFLIRIYWSSQNQITIWISGKKEYIDNTIKFIKTNGPTPQEPDKKPYKDDDILSGLEDEEDEFSHDWREWTPNDIASAIHQAQPEILIFD